MRWEGSKYLYDDGSWTTGVVQRVGSVYRGMFKGESVSGAGRFQWEANARAAVEKAWAKDREGSSFEKTKAMPEEKSNTQALTETQTSGFDLFPQKIRVFRSGVGDSVYILDEKSEMGMRPGNGALVAEYTINNVHRIKHVFEAVDQ